MRLHDLATCWARQAVEQDLHWAAALAIYTPLAVLANIVLAHAIGLETATRRLLDTPVGPLASRGGAKFLLLLYGGPTLPKLAGLAFYSAALWLTLQVSYGRVGFVSVATLCLLAASVQQFLRLVFLFAGVALAFWRGKRIIYDDVTIGARRFCDPEITPPTASRLADHVEVTMLVFILLIVFGLEEAGLKPLHAAAAVYGSWLFSIVAGRRW